MVFLYWRRKFLLIASSCSQVLKALSCTSRFGYGKEKIGNRKGLFSVLVKIQVLKMDLPKLITKQIFNQSCFHLLRKAKLRTINALLIFGTNFVLTDVLQYWLKVRDYIFLTTHFLAEYKTLISKSHMHVNYT